MTGGSPRQRVQSPPELVRGESLHRHRLLPAPLTLHEDDLGAPHVERLTISSRLARGGITRAALRAALLAEHGFEILVGPEDL